MASLAVALPLVAVMIFVTLGAVPVTSAKSESCKVSLGRECSVTFNLRRSDQVSGSVSIEGNSGGDTKFWVTDPSGTSIYDGGKIGGVHSFSFLAGGTGVYVLHFNSIVSPLSSSIVDLSYYVTPAVDC